jgi:signal transduction histidine kinase
VEWSKFIHAALQPYLLVLDLSDKPSDRKQVISEVKSKVLDFQKSVVYFAVPQILSLDDCFRNLNNKWNGILNIIADTESGSKDTNISPQAILDLREVLSELAVNAVKHGGADTLRVEVKSRGSNSLVVRAENNGAPLSKVKPGLGSSIFDLLCGESWSLKNYGGVVVFTCRIYSH